MNHLRYALLAGVVVYGTALNAQIARKYSNEFLSIGVGARSLGMSGAVTSATTDVTSGYWNPAGLAEMNAKFQVGLMHSEYFAGIAKYDYGALAVKLDPKSAIAFSMMRMGVDDIPNTTDIRDANGNINYDRITSFSVANYGFLLSYSRKLKPEGLSIGGSLKVVYNQVGDFAKSWGFGLDGGMRYAKGKWLLAAMGRDITGTFNAWSFNLPENMRDVFNATGNVIPENSTELTLPGLVLGGARKFALGQKFSLLTEIDLITTFDGMRNTLIRDKVFSMTPALGLEAGFKELIFLRAGVGNFQSEKNDEGTGRITTFQPNIGLGVKIKGVMIDYALTNIGASVLYSNVFSLRFDINGANTDTGAK